jgi:tetratricopeptide (TPR) repeat protein
VVALIFCNMTNFVRKSAHVILFLLIQYYYGRVNSQSNMQPKSLEDYLWLGNSALEKDHFEEAIEFYNTGAQLATRISKDDMSLTTQIALLSLYTNLGTALSSVGQDIQAKDWYESALDWYHTTDPKLKEDSDATAIAVQASFFLGMVYQDLDEYKKSVQYYRHAHSLDPLHWSSVANMAAVLREHLQKHEDALQAYNKAYAILTNPEQQPTDEPAEPHHILAELQYRIGNILMDYVGKGRKCSLVDAPKQEVSCAEMAAHAFSLAIQYQPNHEAAKHMLATVTSDATMTRASNDYVQSLFDEYAKTYVHNLRCH